MLLENRVALVTGSSRGIGAVTAKLLAKHGAKVVINYFRDQKAAEEVVAEIKAEKGEAVALQADVTNEIQVREMINQANQRFGFVDTVVLNAAIPYYPTNFLDYDWEDFESRLVQEIRAAFYVTRATVPAMIAEERGCIIARSSNTSRRPYPGFMAYSSAKGALNAFMRSLAQELGVYNIRVNTVLPSLTQPKISTYLSEEQKEALNQITLLNRSAIPEDIAGAILLLASDQAGFVTGTSLPVDGGVLMP